MKGPRLTLEIVDSHTAGEPTRVVIAGAPDLGAGTAAERLMVLRQRHDWLRRAVILEPRGSDLLVGALVLPPCDPACRLAAIFFNNAGYLGMCGHGTIGLVTTLAEGGALSAGEHRIETPVGVVTTRLHEDGAVSVTNVRSYRLAARVPVEVEGVGTVVGDVAWGGNWFFLTDAPDQELSITNVPALTDLAGRIRRALTAHGITGANGAEIDHVELFGPPHTAGGDSRSFVLCPGGAYDRSPCGTGTSAKLACLYADGKLRPGQVWRQESVIGSFFEAQFEADGDGVLPTITGRAYVTGRGTLILDPNDPYRFGIPSPGPSGRGDL